MAKITLTDLANLQNENTAVNAINNNNAILEAASDNTLSRDGTSPNEMESTLDMNSNQIINLPSPSTEFSPLRLKDLEDFLGGGLVVSPLPAGGTAGQVLMKDTSTDYDVSWSDPKPNDIFYVSNYASLQAACDATVANNGGIVFVDQSTNLSSGAIGLDLDGWITPLRITGMSISNGGALFGTVIGYAGSGVAISCVGSISVTIDHISISASQAGAVMVDFGNSASCGIYDSVLYHQVSNASNIGVRLGGSAGDQNSTVANNTFVTQGGTAVVGVTNNFSVAARIRDNKFGVSCLTAINAPGNAWRITGNIFQGNGSVNQKFLTAGPVNTCDTVYLNGNDCDDGTFANTWVVSNAGTLISVNNRYTGALTTAISQNNSTGSVVSIGDYFQGAVGVAIGTGNYLSITMPNQHAVPAQYFTGTPASSRVNHIMGSLAQCTSQMLVGIGGALQGSVRWLNTAGGSNTVVGEVVAGSFTNTLPAVTGTLMNNANTATMTNKTFDTAGAGNVLQVDGVTVSRGQYPGVNGATAATAGNIGEFVTATASGVVLTTATQTTVVTLNIPSAGDWDIAATLFFAPAPTTSVTRYNASISTVPNTFQTGILSQYVDNPIAAYVSGGNTFNAIIPRHRVTTAGPTTYYVVALPAFTVAGLTGGGIATARRVH